MRKIERDKFRKKFSMNSMECFKDIIATLRMVFGTSSENIIYSVPLTESATSCFFFWHALLKLVCTNILDYIFIFARSIFTDKLKVRNSRIFIFH